MLGANFTSYPSATHTCWNPALIEDWNYVREKHLNCSTFVFIINSALVKPIPWICVGFFNKAKKIIGCVMPYDCFWIASPH